MRRMSPLRSSGRSLTLSLAVLVGLVACGGGASVPAPVPRTAQPAAPKAEGGFVALKDVTAKKLPSGATLGVPAGWWMREVDAGLAFQDPDREITITLLEIDAPTTDAAMKAVFAKTGRTAPPKVLREVHELDIAGWDEVGETVWDTPPSEQRVFAVNVRRRGEKVWAALLEGKAPAFARRGAQVAEVVLGLKVPGVAEEDLSAKPSLPLVGERLAAFESFVASAHAKTAVPGMAIAVVMDGKIVLEKGYGLREQGKKDPVTEHTRFMIGSVSKSLSTLLLASLVDEGKLAWDTPITKLLPTFSTADAELTKKLTIAHTFCACTGMPRRDLDLIFEYAGRKPDEVFTAFADVKPTTALGEAFQYSNQMTALGGFLAARVAEPGKPLATAYASAMKARVFAPMGMNETTATFDEGRAAGAAVPHARSLLGARDEPLVLPYPIESFVSPFAPAGAIFSTAHDMARYLLVELGKGKTPEGKIAFSEANMLERRRARVKLGPKGAYGLGLATSTIRGLEVVTHDGGTFGFITRFMVLPQKNLGLVVLTNSSAAGSMLVDAVTQKLLEVTYAGKELSARDLATGLEQDQKEWAREHEQVRKPVPEALAKKLVGTWKHAKVGAFAISNAKDVTRVDVGEWSSRLGYEKVEDGTERLFLVDPPAPGLPLTVEKDAAALMLRLGQESYRLEKK